MGAFNCPKCRMMRHITDSEDGDPRNDRCWFCGTPVPYTEAELQRMREFDAEWAGNAKRPTEQDSAGR